MEYFGHFSKRKELTGNGKSRGRTYVLSCNRNPKYNFLSIFEAEHAVVTTSYT